MQKKFDTETVLVKIIEACRRYGRLPTVAEFKLLRLQDPSFPSKGAITGHFPTKDGLIVSLAQRAAEDECYQDIAAILPYRSPDAGVPPKARSQTKEGSVYLIGSGNYYKIGRSDELERRVKEIRIALPESTVLIHVIRTDDPPGIEAYWHRRFADRRANGEWFKLTPADVAVFKQRKFQ